MSSAEGAVGRSLRRAKRVKHSRGGRAVARFGLASRAIVYLPLAALMVDLAVGRRRGETDQGGALRDLGTTPIGKVLLLVLALGAAAYTIWRWSEAALGRRNTELGVGDRLKAFVEGAGYLPFGVMAVAVVVGDSGDADQAGHYRSISAEVMTTTAGRLLVGAVGVVVVALGCYLFSEGPRRSFADDLDLTAAGRLLRWTTMTTGVVGSMARGAVFALAGVLCVVAAVLASPSRAGGIDSALRTVAHLPFGRVLLVVLAVGIAAFGLFALAEARFRDVR